jgi:hypothetical protein
LDTISWFSFVPPSNDLWDPYHINNNKDMHFRFVPEILDWFILILMGIIVEFNTLFSDKSKSNRMVNEALVGMSDDWKTLSYYLGRVKRVTQGMFIWVIIIVMCFIQVNMQTNLLNWLFFIVNIVNAVIMISGTRTLKSLKIQEGIATFIKVFSITVIVLDIAFVMFIGEQEKFNKSNSLDQQFKKAWPEFYNHLDILGFRSVDVADRNDFRRKFVTYVSYFLLSIYLENHFRFQQRVSEGEDKFTNDQFRRLFEWKSNTEG